MVPNVACHHSTQETNENLRCIDRTAKKT